MTYDNTNRGALFKNDRRQNDRQPEYTGKLNVDGKDFYINGWVKDGSKGKFFSLSVKPVEDAARREQVVRETRGSKPFADDLDDSIPFAPDRN